MNKKIIFTILIIIFAIILLVLNNNKSSDEAPLPTRDVEGLEPITTVEEYCSKLRDLQEFDNNDLAEEYYQGCLAQNK